MKIAAPVGRWDLGPTFVVCAGTASELSRAIEIAPDSGVFSLHIPGSLENFLENSKRGARARVRAKLCAHNSTLKRRRTNLWPSCGAVRLPVACNKTRRRWRRRMEIVLAASFRGIGIRKSPTMIFSLHYHRRSPIANKRHIQWKKAGRC